MPFLATVFVVAVGLAFLALGLLKLANAAAIKIKLAQLGVPRWLGLIVGVIETMFGALLVASAFQPFLTFFAAIPLLAVSIGAVVLHLLHVPRRDALPALVFALALGGAVAFQPLGLRVLALPTHDALPEALVAAETLQTYGPGVMIESVRLDAAGNLFMTATSGLDLATGETSRTRSRIIKRTAEGVETEFFTMPAGTMAGVIAFDAAGTMVATAIGTERGVWRFTPDGRGQRVTPVAADSLPNGIAFGPDGRIYFADSALGVVWRTGPAGGDPEAVLRSPLLQRRPFIALAPGINGLRFVGRDLRMTVSDKALVVKARLKDDGTFSAPTILAAGIPGDDFAVDRDGNLYVTTHPYDTVVRVTPNGERTVIAKAAQGIAGATDAAFGVRPGDETSLYVVTDGGAFAGIPDAAGKLVRLRLAP